MSTSIEKHEQGTPKQTDAGPQLPQAIAAGVNGYPEGQDAAALGAAFARTTGGQLMLVAVFEEPLVILPDGMDWSGLRKQARKTLAETRGALAPDARTRVEGDLSVARALGRVVRRDHRDLLVVGSSRHAPEGRVRIGKRTRQLLCHFDAPLAIAPRGMRSRDEIAFQRIGVGYDGGPEARGALAFAAELAKAADAELHVCAAVDDRRPAMGWDRAWLGDLLGEWQQTLKNEKEELRRQAIEIGTNHGTRVIAEAVAGRPANALLQLSESVDLLVIGSRRWGPAARVLLGSTGEALLHDAGCPVVAVPRPDEPQD